jgi:hypothetical protein
MRIRRKASEGAGSGRQKRRINLESTRCDALAPTFNGAPLLTPTGLADGLGARGAPPCSHGQYCDRLHRVRPEKLVPPFPPRIGEIRRAITALANINENREATFIIGRANEVVKLGKTTDDEGLGRAIINVPRRA